MGQGCITSDAWSGSPLDDAHHFYTTLVPMIRGVLDGSVPPSLVNLDKDVDSIVVVFPYGGREHEGWQRAAIQSLARAAAPKRVNGVVGEEGPEDNSADTVVEWLETAPGITGQLFAVR